MSKKKRIMSSSLPPNKRKRLLKEQLRELTDKTLFEIANAKKEEERIKIAEREEFCELFDETFANDSPLITAAHNAAKEHAKKGNNEFNFSIYREKNSYLTFIGHSSNISHSLGTASFRAPCVIIDDIILERIQQRLNAAFECDDLIVNRTSTHGMVFVALTW